MGVFFFMFGILCKRRQKLVSNGRETSSEPFTHLGPLTYFREMFKK